MGLPDYVALGRDYAENGPPLRLTMALFAGWKPPVKARADETLGPEDLANFLSAFPGGEKTSAPQDG